MRFLFKLCILILPLSLFAKTSIEPPKCIEGMLNTEVKTFEEVMHKKELLRCSTNVVKLVNKCKRTCFTDVKPIDPDPNSSRDQFWDKFTRKLIAQGNHFTIEDPKVGKISIVVEDDYMSDEKMAGFCENLTSNLSKAMEMLESEKSPPGLTIYLYGKDLSKSPPSFGNAGGVTKGSKGLAMAFGSTKGDPTIHEFTHLLTLNQMDSESLSEGLPEYIQYKIQPDTPVGINARSDVKNPDKEALDLIEKFNEENKTIPEYAQKGCKPVNILQTIGSNYLARLVLNDDDKVPHENCYMKIDRDPIGLKPANVAVYKSKYRQGFYHASHSFVKYLVEEKGGMRKFKKLYATGGTPEGYKEIYGDDIDSIRAKWLAHIKAKFK